MNANCKQTPDLDPSTGVICYRWLQHTLVQVISRRPTTVRRHFLVLISNCHCMQCSQFLALFRFFCTLLNCRRWYRTVGWALITMLMTLRFTVSVHWRRLRARNYSAVFQNASTVSPAGCGQAGSSWTPARQKSFGCHPGVTLFSCHSNLSVWQMTRSHQSTWFEIFHRYGCANEVPCCQDYSCMVCSTLPASKHSSSQFLVRFCSRCCPAWCYQG